MGYIHLSNALLKADSSAWGNISDSLHPFVRKDLEDNNAFLGKIPVSYYHRRRGYL